MAHKERLKRSYMVMQDVGYELFADSVEAECSFGIRAADQALVRATLEELELFSYRRAIQIRFPEDKSSDWPSPSA